MEITLINRAWTYVMGKEYIVQVVEFISEQAHSVTVMDKEGKEIVDLPEDKFQMIVDKINEFINNGKVPAISVGEAKAETE
jgi:uncharacterized protein YnzC (UPF0291/DUF896 family)